MVDFGKAAAIFEHSHDRPAICGNTDPLVVMLQGTEEVYKATCACLETGGPICISAAGCEIPIGTSPVNIQAQNRAIRGFHLLAAKPDEF